ncbi:hypothetical protein HK098_000909 [Nowakowskiella sp. JEL0407]|nr:hypothetical protein HK098_000909 [Nowakowskiella sp. JEL0407]
MSSALVLDSSRDSFYLVLCTKLLFEEFKVFVGIDAKDNIQFYLRWSELERKLKETIPNFVRTYKPIKSDTCLQAEKDSVTSPPLRALRRFLTAKRTYPTGFSQVVPPRRNARSRSVSGSTATSGDGKNPTHSKSNSLGKNEVEDWANAQIRGRSESGASDSSTENDVFIPKEHIKCFILFFNTFIAPGASHQVNIPFSIRTRIHASLANVISDENSMCSLSVFDDAVDEILALLYSDSFSKWIQSRTVTPHKVVIKEPRQDEIYTMAVNVYRATSFNAGPPSSQKSDGYSTSPTNGPYSVGNLRRALSGSSAQYTRSSRRNADGTKSSTQAIFVNTLGITDSADVDYHAKSPDSGGLLNLRRRKFSFGHKDSPK